MNEVCNKHGSKRSSTLFLINSYPSSLQKKYSPLCRKVYTSTVDLANSGSLPHRTVLHFIGSPAVDVLSEMNLTVRPSLHGLIAENRTLCSSLNSSVGFLHTLTMVYLHILMEKAQGHMKRALVNAVLYPMKSSITALHNWTNKSHDTGSLSSLTSFVKFCTHLK